MLSWKWTRALLAALATDLTQAAAGVAGILHGAKMDLVTAGPVTLSDRMVLGDWTKVLIADDPDYLQYVPVWTSVGIQQDGTWRIQAPDFISSITSGDLVNPVVLVGVIMADTTGAILLGGGFFNAPKTIQFVGDQIEVETALPLILPDALFDAE